MKTLTSQGALVGLCMVLTLFGGSPHVPASSANPERGPGVPAFSALTVDQAIELVLSRSPALQANKAAIAAAAAREEQAGQRLNPELEVEVEDIGLSGEEKGLDASVFILRAAQPFELGNKRAKRRHSASVEARLVRWDAESARLDLVAAVRTRFIDLLAAQERVRLLAGAHETARQVRDTAAERVRSGKVSPLELTKAEVEQASRRVELKRAERNLASARTGLAALWGATSSEAAGLRADGDLHLAPPVRELETLAAGLGNNPDLKRWDTEEQLALAAVAQQKAARVPDVRVAAAIGHARGEGNQFFELAIELPLPLFDRNAGNIAAALSDVEKVRQEHRATRLQLHAQLEQQWQELQATLEEATSVEHEMLPGARKAFEAAEEAYRSGKLEYLDVLDAQQTLFEVEMQLVDALTGLHHAALELARTTGGPLSGEEGTRR